MQVRFRGVSVTSGRGITLDEFVNYLGKREDVLIKHGELDRRLFMEKVGSDHVGLIVTIKNNKKFPSGGSDRGQFNIYAEKVAEGRSLLEFNIFVLDSTTGSGLYLQYPGSMMATTAGNMFKRQYRGLREDMVEKWCASKGGRTRKNAREVKSLYDGDLKFIEMVRKEDLPQVLRGLDEILSFRYELKSFSDDADAYQPLKSSVTKTTRIYNFKRKLSVRNLANKLVSLINEKQPPKGFVIGREDGLRVTLSIDNVNPTTFGEPIPFDEILSDFNSRTFVDTDMVKKMIALMNQDKSIFRTK